MKKTAIILIILSVFIACKKETKPQKIEQNKNATIENTELDSIEQGEFNKMEQLQWLIGNWINDSGVEKSYENWTKVNDSTFTAHSYTLLGEETVFAEKITLAQNGNDVFFIVNAYLEKEDQMVVFKLINSENGVFAFENPKHDYPKKISYSNPEKNSLHAWIEGTVEGELRKVDFFYRKVN
jgi:hypothetical protein